jgi:hypothetical protein
MKPETAIIREHVGKYTTFGENVDRVVVVDSNKAKFQGYPVGESRVLRRKLENYLIITRPKERLKVVYE